MAVFAFTNGFTSINAVDLSNHVKSVTLNVDVDQLDSTGMGATSNYKSFIGGLKAGTLTIEFMDDFAASQVNTTLFTQLGNVVAFDVRADAGARSATNPSYTGSVLIATWNMGGKLGDLAGKSVTFPTSGAVTQQIV